MVGLRTVCLRATVYVHELLSILWLESTGLIMWLYELLQMFWPETSFLTCYMSYSQYFLQPKEHASYARSLIGQSYHYFVESMSIQVHKRVWRVDVA